VATWTEGIVSEALEEKFRRAKCHVTSLDGLLVALVDQRGLKEALGKLGLRVSPGDGPDPGCQRIVWNPDPKTQGDETVGLCWTPTGAGSSIIVLRLPQPDAEARTALRVLLG
jgi:hypothetical protein